MKNEKILDGRLVSDSIVDRLSGYCKNIILRLALIQLQEDDSLEIYKKNIIKKLNRLGINISVLNLGSERIEPYDAVDRIGWLNIDRDIDGIMLLTPCPKEYEKVINSHISPGKDVDCVTNYNLGNIMCTENISILPCTVKSIMKIIDYYNIEVNGKRVVILGKSTRVGKPLSLILSDRGATVTLCHSKTTNLKELTNQADILISAIGRAEFIDSSYIKDGAVIIDVGINSKDGKIVGDVNFNDVIDKVSHITPVPNGVGSVTTACLIENLICLYNWRKEKECG